MRHVFDVSMPRTGTKSLCLAVHSLGYSAAHGPESKAESQEMYELTIQGHVSKSSVFSRCQFVGHMTPFLDELLHRFNNAKFVLLTRPLVPWLDSCRKHWARHNFRIRLDRALHGRWDYATLWRQMVFGCVTYDRDRFADRYHEHQLRVAEIVPPDRLLRTSVIDGWGPLCEWLGRKVPTWEFPCFRDGAPVNWRAAKLRARRRRREHMRSCRS